MECCYAITGNIELKALIDKFENDSGFKQRIKVVNEFIDKI